MKQPKKLTRNQKILLSKKGIDPKGLLLISEAGGKLRLIDASGNVTEVEVR